MQNYLSETGRYISITPYFKVINPEHLGIFFKYSGAISGYDFKNQNKNLATIQEILERRGQRLIKVYVGKFIDNNNKIKISFIAHNEECTFWWRKYEGVYSINEVYENGRKIKLSQWIKKNIK